MTKLLVCSILSVFFLSGIIIGQDGTEYELTEKKEIKKAIMDYYHEGHVKSDPKLYNEILHDDWKIFYLNEKGELEQANKKTYMSWYDPNKNDTTLNWKTTIKYINVSNELASVKLQIENQKFGYVDYFNLMKIDGDWWIVHKTSHSLKSLEKN